MGNYKFPCVFVYYVLLLSLYSGVSAICTNCSMYLDFSLWEPITKNKATFRILAVTDQLITCSLDFGDSLSDQLLLPPGLTNKQRNHFYADVGIYNVTFDCLNVTKYLPITIESSITSVKYKVKYNYKNSTVDITLDSTQNKSLNSSWNICMIYIDRLNIDTTDVISLLSGISETLREPGFHDIGVKCNGINSIKNLYVEETIHVYDPCFEEKLFPSFPWTFEQKPFEFYKNSHVMINTVSKPVKCAMKMTSQKWIIKKKISTTFEVINWTVSGPFAFPENAAFGQYSIELKISCGKKSHFNTLYLHYKEVRRPLQIFGGSIQFVEPSQKVRLFEDKKQKEDFFYLWCYYENSILNNTQQPLFDMNIENQVNCEPFTKNANFTLPINLTSQSCLVQVFRITEMDFREGRSLLYLTLTQQKKQAVVDIRCIYNCNGQISANFDWILQMAVDGKFNRNNRSITYNWTLYTSASNTYKKFYEKGNWIVGSDTSTLTILNNSLPTGKWLKVCAEINGNSFKGFACNEVFCGSPPSKGSCKISSSSGISLKTKFTINCAGYVDEGSDAFRKDNSQPVSTGIRYAVFYKSDHYMVLIYYGVFPQTGPFHLGAGNDKTNKATIYINIYDIYYSFVNNIIHMTVVKPFKTEPLEIFGKYLSNRISNIDHLLREAQLVILNSVSGVINKMYTSSLMQQFKYDVNDMTQGRFLDFDLNTNSFKTWDEIVILLRDEENKAKVKIYSKIVKDCVEKIEKLLRPDDDEIEVLFSLGALNIAISYFPYVSKSVMEKSVNISEFLLTRALELCKEPIISIFMSNIIDVGEIMLGQLMSAINTDQIILAKDGFAWDTVRKYMEKGESYVKSTVIDSAVVKSEINDFERFYLLQKIYLYSNVGINKKRKQAKKLSTKLVEKQLRYLKILIDKLNPSGRQSKSDTRTFVCTKKSAGNKPLNSIGCGHLNININGTNPASKDDTDMEILTTSEKLFTYDEDMRSSFISQPTIILKNNKDPGKQKFLTVKFEHIITTPIRTTPRFIADDQARLFYHRFQYRSKLDYACIRVTSEQSNLNLLGYEVYFKLLKPPNNDTFDYRTAFSRENATDNYYQLCIPPGVFTRNGSLFVGLRPFFPAGMSGDADDLLAPYLFEAISVNCLVWNKTFWLNNFCKPQWTDLFACECPSNKELTLSNTFFVPPNVIDFSTVFSKFDIINNSTVFSVVLGTFLLFVILFVIALRQDRKEEQMGHFRSLSDNYKHDNFYYILFVYTGLKVGAGTQSNICFLLSGEKATSGVRSLSDEVHKGFKSGSVRKFLMSTPCCLGDLIFLKIWTDGSGKGEDSSWFLDRFEVMEVDSEKKFLFRCNSWLTTDENGRSLHIFPCNRFNDQMPFTYRFKENMFNSLTDGHLWFSAYKRPCYGQFTRAQRVTCCVLVLYLTMIVNAMFYRSGENLLKPNQITLGPLRFSLSQIAISFQSIAITLPPTFLVLMLFKNSKPSTYKPSRYMKNDQKLKKEADEIISNGPSDFPGNGFLPNWCVYIGWLLAILAICASGFFVILFSMQWGKTKSEEWMTTFILSSSESLFLVDPVKVFLIAFVVAFLRKEKQELKLTYFDNMSIMHEIYNLIYMKKDKQAKFSIFPPMGRRERLKRQKRVEHEIWMKSILLNFVLYVLLLWSASSLAFTNRNLNARLFKDHLKKTFADPPKSSAAFSKITDVTSFYKWTTNIVYPALFPENDNAGSRLRWIDKKFINDGVNMKIGPLRMRQLRIQNPENCSTYHLTGIRDCYPAYSFAQEEKSPHCLQWKQTFPCELQDVYNETLVAWSYTQVNQIDELPIIGIYNTYGGGGYVINFQVNNNISREIQNELFRGLWIDRKTRAVFLEFTLYNANSNQFANFFFLVEFPESGGAIPYYQINVITAYNDFDPYTVTCLVTFGLCFVMFMIKNAYNLLKEQTKFFKNFWNLIDLCAFFTTSSVSVAYAMQYFGTQSVLEQFREDPRVFVNFYRIVLWNQIITYNLAFQIFFTIIRITCILGISQRMSEIATLIKRCVRELVGVSLIFSIYTTAFVIVGNLSFPTTYSYRSYLSSLVTIFLLILGKNKFSELVSVSPIIGKIYFMANVFFMIFIILKMFESVLNESISSKKTNKMQLSLLDLFLKQLKMSRISHMSNTAQNKNVNLDARIKKNKF